MGTVTGLMRPWLVACVIAESIGMTASAGAARGATVLSDGGVAHASEVGFALVVLGGLVEGTALGVLQSRALGGLLGHRGRVRWLVATVLVAGVGWAAGSAPSALAEDSGTGSEPSVLAVLLGAAALGAGMGVFLGAAQGWALRGHARHPWRWITASVVGWAGAMPVIFLGATTVGADWPWGQVVVAGTVTGAGAGLVLGLLTGPFLRTFDGPPLRHRLMLSILQSRTRRSWWPGLSGLAVTGTRTGRVYRFPVMIAEVDDGWVVLPGRAEKKMWWRNLAGRPDVEILVNGRWQLGHAELVTRADARHPNLAASYARRWPRVRVNDTSPYVLVRLGQTGESRHMANATADGSLTRQS